MERKRGQGLRDAPAACPGVRRHRVQPGLFALREAHASCNSLALQSRDISLQWRFRRNPGSVDTGEVVQCIPLATVKHGTFDRCELAQLQA